MQYNQPFGGAANAPYINGDPSIGVAGSIPPAASIEYPQRELVALFTAAGLTPTNADLLQLAKAIQNGVISYGQDGGTANAMSVTLNPVPQLNNGLTVRVRKSAASNSGATTLNVNGLGARPVVRMNGTALALNDLLANMPFQVIYDTALASWVLTNFQGGAGGGGGVAIPFQDISTFSGGGTMTAVPSATYTRRSMSSAVIGAHNDVSFTAGSCKIITPGRYLINSTSICGVLPTSFYVVGQYPCALMKNSVLISNGTGFVLDQPSSAVRVKEVSGSNIIVVDLVLNDIIDAAVFLSNPGSASVDLSTLVIMSIARVF